MRKVILIFAMILGISACSNSDEIDNPFDGELVGTVWIGTGSNDGDSYAFLSNKDYKFVERGFVERGFVETGTYTFDGTNGVLMTPDGRFNFKVEDIRMTVDSGSSGVFIKN